MSASPLENYASEEQERADVIARLAAAVREVDEPQARALQQLADRTRAQQFRVVLVGCFSSGKSTLLNALLGQPVLPVKVNPCTAVVTELSWAESPGVEVTWNDGRVEAMTPNAFHDRFQLQTNDPKNELDNMAEVAHARVGWPLPLLRNGVTLVDTPGLDDDPERTERTLRALPEADAVLMVLNATRFLTGLERRTLLAMRPLGLQTLFVPIAMTDLLAALTDDADAAQSALQARAQEHLQPIVGEDWRDRVHWLDGRGALEGRWDRAAQQARQPEVVPSAFAAFENDLTHFLVNERGPARRRRQRDALTAIDASLSERRQLETATADTSAAALQERRNELQPRLDRLDAIARRVERIAAGFVDEQVTSVWTDLLGFLAETEAALPDAVARIDVGGFAGLRLLMPSGRAAVEARLQAGLQEWLDQRMQTWRARCIPTLHANLQRLHQELATEGADFDAVRADVLDAFTAGSVPDAAPDQPGSTERWFAMAMGAALLSPGTVAAGWAQGYEGVLKGAAGRIGARLGVLAIGALLGPPGWAGLIVYVLADALLLATTGGSQLGRLRNSLATALQGRLTAQAQEQKQAVTGPLRDALTPIAHELTAAARRDCDAVASQLDAVIASHTDNQASAEARAQTWATVEQALQDARRSLSSDA